MRQAPCRECNRQGCGSYHDNCPEYAKWQEEKKKFDEARRLQREQYQPVRPYKRKFKW